MKFFKFAYTVGKNYYTAQLLSSNITGTIDYLKEFLIKSIYKEVLLIVDDLILIECTT